jgi:Transposase DDE domain
MATKIIPLHSHELLSGYIDAATGGMLHKKQVSSLADATLGIMASASLAVAVIGHALAEAKGLKDRHAIKQVGRLIGNKGIDVWELFQYWVLEAVGDRKSIVVAIDWTDFDADGQATIAAYLVSSSGRSTPLIWLSMWKEELTKQRNDLEDTVLKRLAEILGSDVRVTIVADRGFGDRKLFTFLTEIGFNFVIRFKGGTSVTASDGETRNADQWVGKGGRARKLRGAKVTADLCEVGAVICVKARDMKEVWCLVTNEKLAHAKEIINTYALRWKIEPEFRNVKDLHFGMGMSTIKISDPVRRDRHLFLSALACNLLTLLGAAGESLGMDKDLRSGTSKRRTHSLFRQGCLLFGLLPNMPEVRFRPLMERFSQMLHESRVFMRVYTSL